MSGLLVLVKYDLPNLILLNYKKPEFKDELLSDKPPERSYLRKLFVDLIWNAPSLHVKKNKPVRGITCTRAASLQLYWWDHDIANS